ncbi:hypothetical protein IKG68_00130 [Candidatus Saccharibacteria bacterium]|nr:hypothetical protein [Candidatus Saccharibacteria bacterium]
MRSAKFAKHKILLIPLSMLAVTLIAGYFLSHIPLGANAVTTSDVSLRVKDTCTMDGNVVTDDSNMLNGQEREGFHVLSLTTYCNDNAGFSIYAVGYSGDLEGSTDLTGATTGLTISTADWADRNTGDNATKSIYSLKIEKDNTSYLPGNISILNGFTNYLAVPSTNTKVASYSSNTDATTGSTINANYAVKVANLQAADTYTGKVKYTMVHPSSNSATGFTFDDAFQLAGKSRVSGTSYFAMQDMNAAICNKVTTPLTADAASTPQTQLIDIRDNKVYWVAKLMDGKCWMTQNLDFDITGPLDSTTTNLTVAGVAPYTTDYTKDETTGKITWTPSATTISAPAINQSFTWIDSYNPLSLDLGDWYYRSDYYNSGDCGDLGCNYHTGNAGNQFSQTPGANGAHSHVGNYYSWSAAVASSDISGYNSGNAANSLCPANWNLPVNGMYGTLNTLYNNGLEGDRTGGNADKNLLAAPLYFVRAGGVWSSTLRYAGTLGVYWSSTVYSSSFAHHLYFHSSGVWTAGKLNGYDGWSLRCVVDDSMQSFDQDAASSLAINESLTLRDSRDNQEYTVAKLKDGKVWMTKNLNLAGGTTITPADSDVAENYTLPASSTTGFDNDGAEYAYVYNSGNNDDSFCNETNKQPCYSYYSYNAATAMSGTSITTDNTDAPYSICSAGWKLPTSRSTLELAKTSSDFYQMAIHYGLKDSVVNENPDNDGMNFCTLGGDCGTNTVPRFLRAGNYYDSAFSDGGAHGGYWSSTASSGTGAHNLYFYSGRVYSADNNPRRSGFSVRCLLK